MKGGKAWLIIFITIIIVLLLLFLFRNSSNREDMITITPSPDSVIATEKSSETFQFNTEQGYDSFLDFPYDDMHFVDDNIYEKIRTEYHKINFFSEFKLGNLEVYDLYRGKFKQLLDNERVFIDKVGNEFFLNELSPKAYVNTYSAVYSNYDISDFEFYFFDMDEDGSPELCIADYIKFPSIYIFKYVPGVDKVFLWYEMNGLWIFLHGSRTLSQNREGIRPVFYKLDENGEEVYKVSFFEREDFNRRINQPEVVYMVALPDYTDKSQQMEITEEIWKQAYFDKGQEWYYFRVTEEQYNELTKDYFKAEELVNKNIEAVSYSYHELFDK